MINVSLIYQGSEDESGLINDQKMEKSDNHIYSLLRTKYPGCNCFLSR